MNMNKKHFKTISNILLFSIISFTLMIFNINSVGANVSGSQNTWTPAQGGGLSTIDMDQGGMAGSGVGFRMVLVNSKGERISINGEKKVYDFRDENVYSDVHAIGKSGDGKLCSKIEHIYGTCRYSEKQELQYSSLKLINTATWNFYSDAPQKIKNFFESNGTYNGLKDWLKKIGYKCTDSKLVSNNPNDDCFIDDVNDTYVSLEPMFQFRIPNNTGKIYIETPYEMKKVAPKYLVWYWDFMSHYSGNTTINFFSNKNLYYDESKNYIAAINNINTINGFMIYKLSDIIGIPDSGTITVNKYELDENGNKTTTPISGVKFKLYEGTNGTNGTYINACKTDEHGKCEFTGIELGKKYSVIEVYAPEPYILSSNNQRIIETTTNKTNYDETFYNGKKNKPKIKIRKVTKDNNGKLIPAGSIEATFNIYKSSKCKGIPLDTLTTKRLSAMSDESIELEEGTYYIKETNISPSNSGYEISKECKRVDLNGSGTVLVDFENPQTCSSELYELQLQNLPTDNQNYRDRLVELFNKYGKKGLFNFTNPSCGNPTCNHNASFMCLNAEYETKTEFNEDNISCYNTQFDYNGHKVYCLDTFQLTNPIGAPKTWNVKAGQMAINKFDRIAATGTVIRKCYFVDGNSSGYNPGKYSDYVSELKFNNESLTFGIPMLKQTVNGNYYSEYSASTNYLFNPVYAGIGNGYISNTPKNKYNLLGYGVVSLLNVEKKYEIPFSITLGNMYKDHVGVIEYKDSNNYRCYVDPEPEIIDHNELNLEFRIIDTSNPFPGKRGNNSRLVGTNWRSKKLDIDEKDLQANITSDELIDSDKLEKYDLNKDGKINYKDLELFNWYSKLKNTNNNLNRSTNLYIKYIMENTNNSYNKDNKNPIYTIKLTPDIIRKIREYNSQPNRSYDDFTLELNNGKWEISSIFINFTGVKIL